MVVGLRGPEDEPRVLVGPRTTLHEGGPRSHKHVAQDHGTKSEPLTSVVGRRARTSPRPKGSAADAARGLPTTALRAGLRPL